MESKELLRTFEDLTDRLESLTTGREVIVQKALKAVESELAEIDSLILASGKELETAKATVIQATLDAQETQEGESYMAVYNRPAVRWDTSKLEGYALAHPEVLALRSYGEPRVSFRKINRRTDG